MLACVRLCVGAYANCFECVCYVRMCVLVYACVLVLACVLVRVRWCMRCFARGRVLSESLGVDTVVQIEELKTKRFQFVKASSALPHCIAFAAIPIPPPSAAGRVRRCNAVRLVRSGTKACNGRAMALW